MRQRAPIATPLGGLPRSTRHPLVPEFHDSGLCLLESLHASNFRMEWTSHPFLKVITVLRGSGEIAIRDGKENKGSISPGMLAVISSNISHRIIDRPGDPLLLHILCINDKFPFHPNPPPPHGVRLINDPVIAGRAMHVLREIAVLLKVFQTGKPGNVRSLLLCGLTATLLGRLLDEPANPAAESVFPDSRARVAGFISRLGKEFFLERPIDAAAAELRLSRRRFTQIFAELAGESYASRLQQLRLAHACRLLQERKLSPVTVAFECGFTDPSTFYRAFKKYTGLSPTRWAAHNGIRKDG